MNTSVREFPALSNAAEPWILSIDPGLTCLAWVALGPAQRVLCMGTADFTNGSCLTDPQAAVRVGRWFSDVLEVMSPLGLPVSCVVEAPGWKVPKCGHTLFVVATSVLSTASSFSIPCRWVHPSTWKSRVGLAIGGGRTRSTKKSESLSLARTTWPECPSHDHADAYLLGLSQAALLESKSEHQ